MQSFDFKNPRSSKLNDKSNGSLQVITDSFLMCLFANFRILCVKFLIEDKKRLVILDDFQNLNKLLFKPKKYELLFRSLIKIVAFYIYFILQFQVLRVIIFTNVYFPQC